MAIKQWLRGIAVLLVGMSLVALEGCAGTLAGLKPGPSGFNVIIPDKPQMKGPITKHEIKVLRYIGAGCVKRNKEMASPVEKSAGSGFLQYGPIGWFAGAVASSAFPYAVADQYARYVFVLNGANGAANGVGSYSYGNAASIAACMNNNIHWLERHYPDPDFNISGVHPAYAGSEFGKLVKGRGELDPGTTVTDLLDHAVEVVPSAPQTPSKSQSASASATSATIGKGQSASSVSAKQPAWATPPPGAY